MTAATSVNGAAASKVQIEVPKPKIETSVFRLIGTSPLICHQWSEKVKREMLDKHMKKASKAKSAKDPQADYEGSLYMMPDGDGYGFPGSGFKKAMVRAGTYLDLHMTYLRGCFHTPDGLVKIIGEPEMREDMVRVKNAPDIRYRGQFDPWEVDLPVQFNANVISQEEIANLLVTAGFSVGVGEWRPEKNGPHGMWTLA